jgi:uncharacterized protein (TIGR03435 family)
VTTPTLASLYRALPTVLAAACLLAAAPRITAQNTPAPPPIAYDAVSIHENKCSTCGGSGRSTPDGEHDINYRLAGFVAAAYGVHPDRVSGLPAWAQEARYDVELKVAPEDMEAYRHLRGKQQMLMLRAVMADRFKLQAHVVPKEFPIYELVVAKDGPKLHQAKAGDTYADGLKMPDGTPMAGSGATMGRGSFRGQQVTIDGILETLRGATGRRVVDKTGLSGQYDISLRWLPDNGPAPMLNGEPDTSLPTIFTAVEEQLGLKLQPAKGLEDTLVVDHIEPPSEN